MGEAPPKNRIDTTSIKGVIDDDVMLSLVLNTLLFRVRRIISETLGVELYKNVSIPWVR